MSSYEFDNSKRPEEPVLDTALDTMLDAMLQEWLEGDAGGDQGSSKVFDPGEIYRSVLKRSETSVFSDQEHAQAISRAQREFLQEGLQESGPDKLEGPSAKPQGGLKNPASGRLWTERFWRSAAIAASIAVSIGGLSLIGRWVQSDLNKPVEVGQTSLDGAPSSGPRLPEAREPEAREPEAQVAEAQVAEPTAKGKQEGMVADSRIVDGALDPERRGPMQDKLAVQRQIEQNQEQVDAQVASEGSKMASALPSARGLSLGTLEDREIVSVIDSQFQQIWKSLGMPESDMVSGGQASLKKRGLTADRIARLLLHRVATDSELEAMRLDRLGEDTQLERLVANWISSDEFDRVWSTRLANFYMGGRIESSQQAVVSGKSS